MNEAIAHPDATIEAMAKEIEEQWLQSVYNYNETKHIKVRQASIVAIIRKHLKALEAENAGLRELLRRSRGTTEKENK